MSADDTPTMLRLAHHTGPAPLAMVVLGQWTHGDLVVTATRATVDVVDVWWSAAPERGVHERWYYETVQPAIIAALYEDPADAIVVTPGELVAALQAMRN
jgi:hypothetical protein